VKVLFLNVSAVLGGAERLLLDLLASLAQADPALALHLVLGEDGPLAGRARAGGVAVTVLPMPRQLLEFGDSALAHAGRWRQVALLLGHGLPGGWAAYRYVGRLRRFIAEARPDIVHSNSLKCHLLGALAAAHQAPMVWHLHDFVGARPVMRRALRWAAHRAAGAVAVSHSVAQDAVEHLGAALVVVVPNAIDTDHFRPGPARGAWLDELAGLPPAPAETVRVGLVATYALWKGQDVFLEAAARVARRRPDLPVRFYVVGGPIYRTGGSQWSLAELRARAAAIPGAHRVGFIDFQADAAPVYRSLDLVVHASTRPEPFGLTIAEAMACGRAVIVSRAGGAAELFTHGHDALGVPPGNPGPLADALLELAQNPLRCRLLGGNARETALARFGRARLGPQLRAAYEHFRNRAAPRGACAAG
jgi:glycosyltransferase involved in cell wall biosynthesis